MPGKKIVFAVQGEGRGHLTQAIAVYESIVAQGHTLSAVMIGAGKDKVIPAFVRERIKAPIIILESPHFIKDKHNRAVSITKTMLHCCIRFRKYISNMRVIYKTVQQNEADVLINFYEPLVGMTALFYPLRAKVISVAHQYLYLHPDFTFPEGSSRTNKWLVRLYTRLTALKSDRLLALSFYPMERLHHNNIIVSPPLLRKDITEQEVFDGRHLLVYLVNAGYMKNIVRWHEKNPETEVHCFTDSPSIKGKWQYHEGLYFHSLDDRKFLYYMANALALVTTAGFESVCEAMYMGKPVLMVPVENHFEQWCNARDAAQAGAGIYADTFEIDLLKEYISTHGQKTISMREWVKEAESILIETISNVGESDHTSMTLNDSLTKQQKQDPFYITS